MLYFRQYTTSAEVGKHIVCIDGVALAAPTIQTACRGEPRTPFKETIFFERVIVIDKSKNKTKMVAMRFREQDIERIKIKAETAEMNVTEFVTAAALDKPVVVIDGLSDVLKEQKAIGRNLNQLTTLCNMGKIQCLDMSEIKQSFGNVVAALTEIMSRCS